MSISKIKSTVLMALTVLTATAFLALPVLAQDGGSGGGGDGGLPPPQGGLFGGNFLFIMAAMFAIIYFFMIRPEQKKQKLRQKMLAALKKGDKVLTIGGLVGVITAVKDTTYIVKSGEGAVFEITKSAISSQINDAKESREALTAETPAPDAKEIK
jgi:preprotein translocase subunit YajC